MKTSQIKVVAASVTGPHHHHKNMPCQDYFKFCRQGKNFVAVVSDGAGSSRYGKIGAKIVCETLIDLLKNAPLKLIQEKTLAAIEVARSKIERHRFNKNKNINDFAATVIGVVYHKGEGYFFHIGDGAGVAFKDNRLDAFVASPPENGNFACETFFFTQENWKNNLRFTRFCELDTIFLMSDGLTNFAFSNDFKSLEKGFIVPIHEFLCAEKAEKKAARALANTLNTTKARKLNQDDKTLLWAKL